MVAHILLIGTWLWYAGFTSLVQENIYWTEKGAISFTSEAPLELIKASSDRMKGAFDLDKKTFAFTIMMDSFDGFNSALQKEHFCEKFMECGKFPKAVFTGKIIEDLEGDLSESVNIRAKGKLTIHGITQERILQVQLSKDKNQITALSNFTVRLEDHQIKIPKVVTENIAEIIRINVYIVLSPKSR